MEYGRFVTAGWDSGPVSIARTFKSRWRGLRPAPLEMGLWLVGNSVHGFGLKVALIACGLGVDGDVLSVRVLRPGRIVVCRGAHSVLELPMGRMPPPLGSLLTWEGARSPDSLRHSDREPR
jgi:hypothetical protein